MTRFLSNFDANSFVEQQPSTTLKTALSHSTSEPRTFLLVLFTFTMESQAEQAVALQITKPSPTSIIGVQCGSHVEKSEGGGSSQRHSMHQAAPGSSRPRPNGLAGPAASSLGL